MTIQLGNSKKQTAKKAFNILTKTHKLSDINIASYAIHATLNVSMLYSIEVKKLVDANIDFFVTTRNDKLRIGILWGD